MSIGKNKGLWLGAGALGCFGMVMVAGFIVVGGVALYLMSPSPAPAPDVPVEPQGFAPDGGEAPVVDAEAQEDAELGDAPVSATVTLEGQVVDAASGQGVGGAYFFVLMPGKTFADLQGSGDPAGDGILHSAAVADGSGAYRISDVERGYTYTVVIAADGYQPQYLDHGLEINSRDPEVTRLTPVSLQRQ